MIKKELLEVYSYKGDGFKPLVVYKSWRVAILNFIDELEPENIGRVERHPETDEVFVLTRGEGVLFVGEGEPEVKKLFPQVMEQGVIYNVKPHTWHTIELDRDASVLIVENADTGEKNSEYCDLSPELKQFIRSNSLKK
jgi:ureidoglycolate hydrolase